MAKQTFTTGQVLTAAQMTSLQQTAMLGGDTTAKTTSYTLVAADAGTVVAMNSSGSTTITVNTSIFSAGDIVTIQNRGSGTCTVTAGTATVNTSGSLVLAQYQGGVLYFNSASAAVFYQFATPASGDIEGVTAGTGISGGGTSGTVTITNSMATAIDAKGDLIVGTGADTFSRLAVGTNDYVLTAASGETTGLKWSAPSSGALVKITSGSLSGTTISLDNVFSSTYTNYLLMWNVTDTDGAQYLRFRASGTDNSSTSYEYANWQSNMGSSAAWSLNSSNGASSATECLGLPVGSAGSRYRWSMLMRTVPVSSTQVDKIWYNGTFNRGALNGLIFGRFTGGDDFDGFTVYNTGSTWSGTYEVYGYAL